MATKVLFCNGSQDKIAFNEMLCSLMEKAAIETAVVFGKLAVCLLAMGTLSNGLNMMGNEIDIKQGDKDSFPVEVKQKVRKGETQFPSQKDDGDTDDDDDDEDEDADDLDDDGGEDDLSGEEGNDNEGDEDPEDAVEANGEGGSDDGDEDGEDDDEDDDDDDDDDGDEEDEDEEDEEEIPEPPSKKRK